MIKQFNFEQLDLDGAYLISPFFSIDKRGTFIKDYSKEIFENYGINYDLKEVFYTYSKKGVLRGLHFQKTIEQPKLVRCVFGKIYDVIVDLRKDSRTYLKWLGFYLSEENKKELLIPAGFAHGYLVLEESIVSYKCSEKFFNEFDTGIIWNDKKLMINWPLDEIGGLGNIIISEKDRDLPSL